MDANEDIGRIAEPPPSNENGSSILQDEGNPHIDDKSRDNGEEGKGAGGMAMPTVFLGNLSHMCTVEDIHYMFEKNNDQPIPVLRVDMKRGFCFVYLKDATSPRDKERIQSYVADINGM